MPDRLLIPNGDDTHDHELARKIGRAELARRLLLGFLVLGVLALLVMQTIVILQVRHSQLEGTPVGKRLLASSDRILDCTDGGDKETGRPPGECFVESQKRTADAVGDINRVVVIAAACAAGLPENLSDNQRVIRTQRCLIDQLAAR